MPLRQVARATEEPKTAIKSTYSAAAAISPLRPWLWPNVIPAHERPCRTSEELRIPAPEMYAARSRLSERISKRHPFSSRKALKSLVRNL